VHKLDNKVTDIIDARL